MKGRHGLIRPALIAGMLGASARVTAAVAGIILAYKFGAGEATDAYLLAKTVPVGVYLILDSVLYNALVPILRRDQEPVGLFRTSLLLATGVAVLLAVGGYFGATVVIGLLGRGADVATQQDAAALQRITALAIAAAVPSSALKAWNACHDRYIAAALDGCIVSGLLLLVLLFCPAEWGMAPVAMALPAAFLLLLGVQGALARGAFKDTSPGTPLRTFPWRRFRRPVAPLLALNAIQQLQVWVVVVLASHYATGAVSQVHYSYGIAQIPVGVIDLVLFSTFFPFAAGLAACNDQDQLAGTFRATAGMLLVLCVPLAIWLILSRGVVVDAILARGHFDAEDARFTTALLVGHAAAIPGWCLEALGCRMLFALDRHARYLGIVVCRLALFVLSCGVLLPLFGLPGLSLSFAGAFTASALLSVIVVWCDLGPGMPVGTPRALVRPVALILGSGLVMTAGIGACQLLLSRFEPVVPVAAMVLHAIVALPILGGALLTATRIDFFRPNG